MKKGSFILYADAYESIRSLTLAQKGQLLDAMFIYQRGEEMPEVDPVVEMAFSFIKRSFDRDADKYAKRCEKARESAKMRWDANACERIKRNAKHADNDNVPYPDTVSKISSDNSDEQPGALKGKPSKCSEEDWKRYMKKSEQFLTWRQSELGKMVKITTSTILNGAKALDNLVRVQGFSEESVLDNVRWGAGDSFWGKQIRSLGSLTKKSSNGDTKYINMCASRMTEKVNAS